VRGSFLMNPNDTFGCHSSFNPEKGPPVKKLLKTP
jgi:hypothetical protein